jgi:hypothetical protein
MHTRVFGVGAGNKMPPLAVRVHFRANGECIHHTQPLDATVHNRAAEFVYNRPGC